MATVTNDIIEHPLRNKRTFPAVFCFVWAFALATVPPAQAAGSPAAIDIHAGKADSAYHALAVQFAEAVAIAANGSLTLDVHESQGSVQNIIEALHHDPNYIFTATPSLIAQARRGEKPFSRDPRYGAIRALFPIPALTMHWLVRADSGVKDFSDLVGRSFIPGGKGSYSEQQTAAILHTLGIEASVQLIDIDAGAAPAALLGKQVIGAALAGPYPMPAVQDLAGKMPVRLLSLTPAQLKKTLASDDSTVAQIIPKGTYPGIDEDTATIALPAGAYTTARMSDAVAYAVTKAFWTQQGALALRNPPWGAVRPAALAALGVRLHPGALRYYREIGVKIPQALR